MNYYEQRLFSESENSIEENEIPALPEFLDDLKTKMKNAFRNKEDGGTMRPKRGVPQSAMQEIMSGNPLSAGIPKEYGGRGGLIHENLALLAAASYESLALSLTLGINLALFLQPVAKYALEETKKPVFKRFLEEKNMGGLMITEPGFGSDALNMQTSYKEKSESYFIKGKKHWAGLTGWADFWLLTARKQNLSGNLQRDIDFFICDVNAPGQQIVVEEFFETPGLYNIPYGRNHIDVKIPEVQKLQPHTTGVKMMLDLLHRSRMQFPGMGLGFIKRMLDDSIAHCKQRFVGAKSLFGYDQVQQRLAKLQAIYTVCSAMCTNSSDKAGTEHDLSSNGLEANAIKSVITDYMHEAAQSAIQLFGAKAYKTNHVAGMGMADSRPFQIFEGSNDILYAQITEGIIKLMKRSKETNLYQFLKKFDLTELAAGHIKSMSDFNLDLQLPQRKLVEMGKIIGRVISLNQLLEIADKGFRKDLIEGGVTMLRQEIAILLEGFSFNNKSKVVEGYEENSSWLNFVTA